ncbi:peptidase S8/S53 domain-containing protein [Phlyctochytrium arcticum]|nr:peptidase S8/S53 domain-containing protein [Phlyctochytrium arcticum]
MKASPLLLLLAATFSPALAAPAQVASVHKNLEQKAAALADDQVISFAVQLRDHLEVDVSKAPKNLVGDFAGVGSYVYDQLVEAASNPETGIDSVIKSLGDEIKYSKKYLVSNSFIIDGTKKAFETLRNNPNVLSITANDQFKVDLPASTGATVERRQAPAAEPLWSLKQVGAPAVWASGFRGGNLTYANADVGVEWTHPDLKDNYIGNQGGKVNHNYAWWDGVRRAVDPAKPNALCKYASAEPCADGDHGTHTTSTSVGKTVGVAPGARWMACRNMDDGLGRPETYLNCLEFFIAPTDLAGKNADPSKRPHVIGNSYGCPSDELCDKTTFTTALKNLKAAGIFMSVSAGNSFREQGCNSVSAPPAISGDVVSVAAIDEKRKIAPFSSRGEVQGRNPFNRGVDISAPGVQVLGAVNGGKFEKFSGTSMASPHVAGAIMLLSEACPHLQREVQYLAELLYTTADKLVLDNVPGCGDDKPYSVPNTVFGYGALRVDKAIASCKVTEPNVPDVPVTTPIPTATATASVPAPTSTSKPKCT